MKNGKKRQSPSVERQLALALVAVLEANEAEAMSIPVGTATETARHFLSVAGYQDLESIPSRVKRIKAAIKDAMEKGEWSKIGKLGNEMTRAEKGLPPLATEKKPRAPRKPKTETPSIAEKKPRKKKDKGTGDLVLHDDTQIKSLTEGDEEWLTRHPEP